MANSTMTTRNEKQENTVLKSATHPAILNGIFNERDFLLRFKDRTPLLRPLIDEIQQQDPAPGIVLRYLDDDMLHASNTQRLTRLEVKYVARRVLEAFSLDSSHQNRQPCSVHFRSSRSYVVLPWPWLAYTLK